ncbi:hypothetical protein [Halocatena pleomorpha]|uniref:Uncharacterized protein n=1 Tax=Halocatena pleomorpha TaxID=1785090 RepID=A0A3P3RML9_9EURY|nr:hypothetical protein [Halocatena pleomorpha]RRJ33633.1 hypothetical protein EIK79_02210 [Halocatena pleomorpha]
MLSVHNLSYTRPLLLFVIVGSIALSGLAMPASPSTIVDQSAPPQNVSDEHTMVIKTTDEPIQYVLSATGRVRGEPNESDAVQGRTLSGRVGGVSWNNTTDDTTDTVTYTGYIESFQPRGGDPQLRIEGQQISPDTLSANHLRIARPNSSTNNPINYEITVTGDATPGESTEGQDQTTVAGGANGTRIQGQLTDQYDSFYFTGNTTSTSFDRQARVFINGQNTAVQNSNNGTQTDTHPTPIGGAATDAPVLTTTERTTSQPTNSRDASQAPADSGRTDTTQATSNEGAESSESTSPLAFLFRVASGLVLVALLVGAGWYFLPRQQRW